MKKNIATKWMKALRSGKYRQGKNYLANAKGEYCCLGVLCDLAEKEGVVTSTKNRRPVYEVIQYGEEIYFLPEKVMEWAGIKHQCGEYSTGHQHLAGHNDNGNTFKQIADIIEAHVEDL